MIKFGQESVSPLRERRQVGFLLLLLAWIVACGPRLPELETVQAPDLSGIEATARAQIEAAQDRLDKSKRRGSIQDVADAFGGLGEVYHAYDVFEPAAAAYRNAETLDPQNFVWSHSLGLLLAARGDFAAAESAFARALDKNPQYAASRARLIETAVAAADWPMVEKHAGQLVTVEGFQAFTLLARGRAAVAANDPTRALADLEQARALAPAADEVYPILAQALRALGRTEEAKAALGHQGSRKVPFPDLVATRLETLPNSAGARLKRGAKLLVEGRLAEAERTFRDGMTVDPENLELRLNLGLTLVKAQRLDEALVIFREATAKFPASARAHHDLGTALIARNLMDDAVAAFRQAAEIEPGYVSAHFNLANVLVGLKRPDEAAWAIDKVLELEPKNNRARYLQAMVQHARGQSGPATERLRTLVAEEPDNAFALEGLGTVLADTNKLEEAMALFRAAAARYPAEAPEAQKLFSEAAKIAWRKNRRDLALELYRDAVAKSPGSAAALTDLANGLQLTGKRAEAAKMFRRATELDPKNPSAWLSESALLILDGDFRSAHNRLDQALMELPGHAALGNTLARLLATCPDATLRDGKRAFELAKDAYAKESRLENAETVAMALAEMGQFEEAIRFQRNLVAQAQAGGDRAAFSRLVKTLKLYENRQPLRANL